MKSLMLQVPGHVGYDYYNFWVQSYKAFLANIALNPQGLCPYLL
jgi:hypothetical protein